MAIKQRLYPTAAQAMGFNEHFGQSRLLYNLCVEVSSFYHKAKTEEQKKHFKYDSLSKQLTELRAEYDWLEAGSQNIQQNAIRNYWQGMLNFFKNPGHFGKPVKKKKGDKESFTINGKSLKVRQALTADGKIRPKWAEILVPKIGYVPFRLTRPLEEIQKAKTATITRHLDRYTVAFTLPQPEFTRTSTGQGTGIDRGVTNTVTLSNGFMSLIMGLTEVEEKRLIRLQQQLERQQKGSKRRKETLREIRTLRFKQANRRKNWIEQITTRLVRNYDYIILEDLEVKDMMARPKPIEDPNNPGHFLPNGATEKSRLNKGIQDSCWSAFANRLQHKAGASPKNAPCLVDFTPAFHTSQQCSRCHCISEESRESQALFLCQCCGLTMHADWNAAINILRRGIAAHNLASAPEDIREAGAVASVVGNHLCESQARQQQTTAQ